MNDEHASRRLGRVVGKYTLERVIGSGGMATVYEASHRNGNRVAVKMLKPALAVGSEVRGRFLREGYAANKVGHSGAVRVLDDDVTDDGLVFLVMELLHGWTLDALATMNAGKLPAKTLLQVGKQLLDVLEAAHHAGIVHRDIKPENVFVQTTGTLKVLDFGVARILSPRDGTTTTTGRMLGTPAFMPPEQAYGRRAEVDARSDLWSVGATLFTALTGRVVHVADTAEETLIKAATEPAPQLATVAAGVHPSIAAVIDRSLVSDKSARWQSAREMRDALELAQESAFREPIASVIDLGTLTALAPSVEPVASSRTRRALGFATWATPITVAAALVMSGKALAGDPNTGHRAAEPIAVSAASAVAPAAIVVAAPAAPAAIERADALSDAPAPTAAREAPLPRADKAPAARIVAVPSTAASGTVTAPAASAPSRACGFEFDEEGRKWPKRCP